MPLKFKLSSKEEVPSEVQALYVERDGAFVLDVEGAIDAGKVEEFRSSNAALARERDELKRRFERSESEQVRAIAAERDALNARLTALQVDQGVTSAATRKGLRPTAIPDITSRARGAFRLVDGAPRIYEADGQTVRLGKDGVSPMSVEEWVDLQISGNLRGGEHGGESAGDSFGVGGGPG